MPELPRLESARWVTQLERPQKVAGLLEVGAHGKDFMNQVLHTHNTKLAEFVFDNGIVRERDTLLVHLSVTTFVHKLTGSLERGVPVRDIRLHNLEHFGGSFRKANEDPIVDLKKPKKPKNLAWLWGDLVDTAEHQSWSRELARG